MRDMVHGFGKGSISLHWIVAVGIVGMIVFGMVIGAMPSGPGKTAWIQLHKSFGVLVGALALVRLVWRLRQGFPEPAAPTSLAETRAARSTHVALLALTVVMPLSGMLKSVTYGRPVEVFGVPVLPQLLAEKHVASNELASWVHGTCGWLLAGLVVVHVCGALKHHLWDRDLTLRRMLRPVPDQR